MRSCHYKVGYRHLKEPEMPNRTSRSAEVWTKLSRFLPLLLFKNTIIFKNGKKGNPENYQLVGLTSVPVKIMKEILLEHMLKHMEGRGEIQENQHGFKKGKSCLTK